MHWLVTINLGAGTLWDGCSDVVVQVSPPESRYPSIQLRGSLPPAPDLAQRYQYWQLLYREFYETASQLRTICIEPGGLVHFSEIEFHELGQQIIQRLNQWLDSSTWQVVVTQLQKILPGEMEILFAIETDDDLLQRLPWHFWRLILALPKAEVILSSLEYVHPIVPHSSPSSSFKILAVLGKDESLNLETERELLKQLRGVESVFLEKPDQQTLDLQLQDCWSILFFAGHSFTVGDRGHLQLNPDEVVEFQDLQESLKVAIHQGLKLAIFNSCDGLGLMRVLWNLAIPHAIVMREPVPDAIAQLFFRGFLQAFSSGESLAVSIRIAREQLTDYEDRYPCASWLPVLCQHPATQTATWQEWQAERRSQLWRSPPSRQKVLLSLLLGTTTLAGAKLLGDLTGFELFTFLWLWQKLTQQLEAIPPRAVASIEQVQLSDPKYIHQLLQDQTINLELIHALVSKGQISPEIFKLQPGSYPVQVRVQAHNQAAEIHQFKASIDLTRPAIVDFPRHPQGAIGKPIPSIDVQFSEPIDPLSFDSQDLAFFRDGNLIPMPSNLKIIPLSSSTFRIQGLSSLTQALGNYQLSINTKGIQDQAGNTGATTVSVDFSRTENLQLAALQSEGLRNNIMTTNTSLILVQSPFQSINTSRQPASRSLQSSRFITIDIYVYYYTVSLVGPVQSNFQPSSTAIPGELNTESLLVTAPSPVDSLLQSEGISLVPLGNASFELDLPPQKDRPLLTKRSFPDSTHLDNLASIEGNISESNINAFPENDGINDVPSDPFLVSHPDSVLTDPTTSVDTFTAPSIHASFNVIAPPSTAFVVDTHLTVHFFSDAYSFTQEFWLSQGEKRKTDDEPSSPSIHIIQELPTFIFREVDGTLLLSIENPQTLENTQIDLNELANEEISQKVPESTPTDMLYSEELSPNVLDNQFGWTVGSSVSLSAELSGSNANLLPSDLIIHSTINLGYDSVISSTSEENSLNTTPSENSETLLETNQLLVSLSPTDLSFPLSSDLLNFHLSLDGLMRSLDELSRSLNDSGLFEGTAG